MKANITFLDTIFDEEPKLITVYGKSKNEIFRVCETLGNGFVLTNVYITEDKSEEKKVN